MYNEKFDQFMDIICKGDEDTKDKLKDYILHRKEFGKDAANNKYPEIHKIEIEHKVIKDAWKLFLRRLDKERKK